MEKIMEKVAYILRAIIILGIIVFLVHNDIISTDKPTIIALTILIIFLIPTFIFSVSETIIIMEPTKLDLTTIEKIKDYSYKAMIIIFWLFWFSFLIYASYFLIKKYNGGLEMCLLTLPFALVGIFGIKETLFKNKKN